MAVSGDEGRARRGVMPPDARCLREDDAAAYVSLSQSAFRKEWQEGRAPPPVQLTIGRQGWLVDALDAYIDRLATASPRLRAWLRSQGLDPATLDRKGAGRNPDPLAAPEAADEWDAACYGSGGPSVS